MTVKRPSVHPFRYNYSLSHWDFILRHFLYFNCSQSRFSFFYYPFVRVLQMRKIRHFFPFYVPDPNLSCRKEIFLECNSLNPMLVEFWDLHFLRGEVEVTCSQSYSSIARTLLKKLMCERKRKKQRNLVSIVSLAHSSNSKGREGWEANRPILVKPGRVMDCCWKGE